MMAKIKKTLDGNLDTTVDWNNSTDMQSVANAFYDFLQNKKAIDFNEILYRSYKIVTENDFVVTSIANKFYEISIDEFLKRERNYPSIILRATNNNKEEVKILYFF